jgi:creatinine amidohydrolase
MGVFSDGLREEVRVERMRPEQVDAAMRRRAAVYVPFGSVEWHGRHLPLGLDAIKAHEHLVGLAARVGGVVYPPFFIGSGGGHTEYPHTHMVEAEPMRRIVLELLRSLERAGFTAAILLTGHYPNRDEYLLPALDAYERSGGTMRVLAVMEHQADGVEGDHAGAGETSMLMHLHPETVDLARLGQPTTEERAKGDAGQNWMPDELRAHPCWGIAGRDPRLHASAARGATGTENLLRALEGWLDGKLNDGRKTWHLVPV